MMKPFEIESVNINKLNATQLTKLLNKLLRAEAYKFGIPQSSVEVGLNLNAPDGGEDGRISWNGDPEKTDFVPNRLTIFQNKAMKMGSAAYAKEIMTKATKGNQNVLKPKVRDVFDQGGSYIFFTTQELNPKQKKERIATVNKALCCIDKPYEKKPNIDIYDATMIAEWVNQFVAVIVAVQSWSGTPTERGLKTYELWGEDEHLSRLDFIAAESRKDILQTLSEKIEEPKSCFRVIGLSGLGKTRTAFQIFKEDKNLAGLVVYFDASYSSTIHGLVADWVSLGLKAIVVVDNCDYSLHNSLAQEVRRTDSQISLLTLDYNNDTVEPKTIIFKLNPMAKEEISKLLNPVYGDRLPDLGRIVKFAQGFPQMAVLLADARLADDPRMGELTDDDLVRKLLWRRNETENQETLKILQACSLFDAFGVEGEVENQLKFIANLIGINIDDIYACVQHYSERGIIDRRGRFRQVVPKPLAISLAGQWWKKSMDERKSELIASLPKEMVEGFCNQVEMLDFHPEVKKLTEKLCGPLGPFGHAEVILSNRGSRLFRAFVNVSPESTSHALYKTLEGLDHQQLNGITGSTRRNLVWALEMLCYHENIFHESAWSMLLLASAENESWNNNATGLFSQLFRVTVSGTTAKPETRFKLIKRALELRSPDIDMVLLEALKEAIDMYSSRTTGAEYQGTRPPLEEWQPKTWQDIFDFWQEAFDLMLVLMQRGAAQKEKAMENIGHSIGGLASRGRIEMLDSAIREIVSVNGCYWPAALDSIKNALEYNSKGMKREAVDALNKWQRLLDADDAELPVKLKIRVIAPYAEYRKGEDGQHIDIAAQGAEELAKEVSRNIEELIPHLDLLLRGEQGQSHAFGYYLAQDLVDVKPLLDSSLRSLLSIEQPNPEFIFGLYRGIFEKSPKIWQENIDRLLTKEKKEKLVYLYPDLICTGRIKQEHLGILLNLIRRNVLPPNSANALRYGQVIDSIEPKVMAGFCLQLAELGSHTSWPAFNVIYGYCYKNENKINQLQDQIKQLVTTVSLGKDQANALSDAYRWHDMAKKLLEEPDQEFAIALTHQLISACKSGLNHRVIKAYARPLLLSLFRDYGDTLWPIFGNAVVQADEMEKYWLQKLLYEKIKSTEDAPSGLSVIPVEIIIEWCMKLPDLGPVFIASCVNIFETIEKQKQPSALFIAILEHFGGDEHVREELNANMVSRCVWGSFVPYLKSDKVALSPLLDHENAKVRCWVKDLIDYIDKQIERERDWDDERNVGVR